MFQSLLGSEHICCLRRNEPSKGKVVWFSLKFPTKFIGISLPNDQFHRKGQLEWQKTDLDGDGQISWYEFRRRFINTEDIEPGLIKLFQFANLDVSMIYDPRYEDLLQTFKDSNASTLATIGTMASLPPKSTVELEVSNI